MQILTGPDAPVQGIADSRAAVWRRFLQGRPFGFGSSARAKGVAHGIPGKAVRNRYGPAALDPASPGAERGRAKSAAVEPFVKKLHGAIEIIPAERSIYVYIGRPPDRFGIAWFAGDATSTTSRRW